MSATFCHCEWPSVRVEKSLAGSTKNLRLANDDDDDDDGDDNEGGSADCATKLEQLFGISVYALTHNLRPHLPASSTATELSI